jgi:hypothetical protein
MIRSGIAVALAVLTTATGAWGQAPGRLRWQVGQVLQYRVEQETFATDVVGDNKVDTKTRHTLTKRWQVLAVDPAGVATVQLSILAMLLETTTPSGDVLRYDSTSPDKSNPQMREQLSRFVGQPVAVLRVDGQGRVVEVKESRFGPASRFDLELPFVGVLPDTGLQPGQAWERSYQITLEPPTGTGEKYAALQRYMCKGITGNLATIAMTTDLKTQPEAVADRIPLIQNLPEGEVVFDLQAGRLQSAVLKTEKELKGHQGEGSSYHFKSTYLEQYIGDR